jgi:phosphohistidine phosphatase SixA
MNHTIVSYTGFVSPSLLLGLFLGALSPLPLAAAELVPTTSISAAADESALVGLAAVLPNLRAGGYVIYFRHGVTDQNIADDAKPDFLRCETQRNLTEQGRAQAREIGKAIVALGIPVGAVISSPFCRTKENAQLAFGHYQVDPDLYFALNVDASERDRLTHALRRMLSTPPTQSSNTVIIAHSANLKESTGFWPKPEGVAYVFKPTGGDRFVPVAKVLPDDWAKLSATLAK